MTDRVDEFRKRREALNERIFRAGHRGINRFFALDNQAYGDGALLDAPDQVVIDAIVAPKHGRRDQSEKLLCPASEGPVLVSRGIQIEKAFGAKVVALEDPLIGALAPAA